MGDKFVSEVVRDINCIEGKNILLLLEGWDELPEDKQLHKSFFANTIAGKVLKKGNILITSRPSSIGSILHVNKQVLYQLELHYIHGNGHHSHGADYT